MSKPTYVTACACKVQDGHITELCDLHERAVLSAESYITMKNLANDCYSMGEEHAYYAAQLKLIELGGNYDALMAWLKREYAAHSKPDSILNDLESKIPRPTRREEDLLATARGGTE